MTAYSWWQRLVSLRHGFWFGLSRRIRWSRGVHRETPARELRDLPFAHMQRIGVLRDRYRVRFERELCAATSLRNYEYLGILDTLWAEGALRPRTGGVLCDVGCASFDYAAALQAFFHPQRLLGFDVEGHRLLRDGRSRIDYARGYLADIPQARFVVADYASVEDPADIVTAWFPFVFPGAILAWRLPLRLLQPERLLRQIYHNLRPGGLFVMVNHGPAEAAMAEDLCTAIGFIRLAESAQPQDPSGHRPIQAIASCWKTGKP